MFLVHVSKRNFRSFAHSESKFALTYELKKLWHICRRQMSLPQKHSFSFWHTAQIDPYNSKVMSICFLYLSFQRWQMTMEMTKKDSTFKYDWLGAWNIEWNDYLLIYIITHKNADSVLMLPIEFDSKRDLSPQCYRYIFNEDKQPNWLALTSLRDVLLCSVIWDEDICTIYNRVYKLIQQTILLIITITDGPKYLLSLRLWGETVDNVWVCIVDKIHTDDHPRIHLEFSEKVVRSTLIGKSSATFDLDSYL